MERDGGIRAGFAHAQRELLAYTSAKKRVRQMAVMADKMDVGAAISADDVLVRKIGLRLIPFLFVLYVIAYIDRVNLGFAKLSMNTLPWLANLPDKEAVYGAAGGIFFLAYFLFEIPSNLLMQRVGARRWIMRIMITWGIVACSMLYVDSVGRFFTLRFLLGIAEAGFFPGVLLYLTYWFTAKERARVVALFMTANAASFIVGGPLSGWILKQPPVVLPFLGTLSSWQQMFLYEGIPAILMGFVVLAYLPDKPQNAGWLNAAERARIVERLRDEQPTTTDHPPLLATLLQPDVLLFCAIFFCLVTGMYGFSLWLPQIVKDIGGLSNFQVGLLTAVPYLFSAAIMVLNGWHSDRTQERRWHIAVAAFFGALGLLGYAYLPGAWLQIISLSVAASGMWSILGPFWALPSQVLRRGGTNAVAGGLAMINSVGNLGGFAGPWMVGVIKDKTGYFPLGITFLAALVVVGGLLALRVRLPESDVLDNQPSPKSR